MKKLLLLGGSNYLLPVIREAHALGLYVVTCDYLPDNTAHKYADEYRNVSIIDKEAVLETARELGVSGVMSFACDPGVTTAAYVAEKLGLPFAGSYNDNGLRETNVSGHYWSRTLCTGNSSLAYGYGIYNPSTTWGGNSRYCGYSVRPVRRQYLVESIELDQTQLMLKEADEFYITATVLPSNASNKDLTWESSNEAVATFNLSADGTRCLVKALSEGTCTITCRAEDGSGIYAECQVTVESAHEYVDLDLPSGTLWATCNVGADTSEEYGNYYAWGEILPKEEFSYDNYQWMNEGQADRLQMNKYTFADGQTDACWYNASGQFIGDGYTELLSEDDAATANWGAKWQMPSKTQCDELFNVDNTERVFLTQNGVNGLLITSKRNGKSVFLPAAGYRTKDHQYHLGTACYYTSRSLATTRSFYAYVMAYYTDSVSPANARQFGRSVRPVRKQ